jgi:predicted  nucleic acid-binding Zn-ribbon protein
METRVSISGVAMKSCPKCGSGKVYQDKILKMMACGNCGLRLPRNTWKEFSAKMDTMKESKQLEVEQAPLTEQEAYVVAKRRDELWNRLDRFGTNLTHIETIKAVKNVIRQYIAELELRGEIPKGLIIKKIGPNEQRYTNGPFKGHLMYPGHLVVEFGISNSCKHKDELLPFLGGRKCLL